MRKIKEKRMQSYVLRARKMVQEGKNKEGAEMLSEGLNYYSKKIDIIRNERKYFSFRIHSLSDEMLKDIRKKYTKYTKNRRQGIRVADELDLPKYRASLIYNSTTEEDQAKLWDNPAVKKGLEAKGICIINALDVIDAVLLPGEKDRIMDIIDDVNGFNNEELKAETAKN